MDDEQSRAQTSLALRSLENNQPPPLRCFCASLQIRFTNRMHWMRLTADWSSVSVAEYADGPDPKLWRNCKVLLEIDNHMCSRTSPEYM